MLARLQSAMGRDDLIDQMVLLPEPKQGQTRQSINLIVGYDASPNSHTALDIAFWIAHQTRLATNQEVTVQAVYVIEEHPTTDYYNILNFAKHLPTREFSVSAETKSATSVITQPKLTGIKSYLQTDTVKPLQEADRVLWQARSLSEEWQGSFKSHLRFGCVSTELRKVAEFASADVLFVGCQSFYHPLIETLGANFPCAVLGIPECIDE
ncbi:universal stress protein [Anabaena subtropica]|uniref:Universal stress protein n=1 Tax=Anabaena subtropica FACHB-260 TaxID=2692884 RepID=A0ABR8CU60_9NOST|nr:universal stress protein [Anabaena subtropica]MBD2346731.1 universal stress protein [Anabaena subtropica FACHB-260]